MNVYGPRQDYFGAYIAVIVRFLDRIDQGEPPTLYGDGSQAYDFVCVGDCAQANICAMRAETVDHFYNVGTGVRTTVKELAELILRLSGSNLPIRYEPADRVFVKNRIGCPKQAAAELGFTAEVPLEEGLRELIEWRAGHRAEVEARRRSGAYR